MEVLRRGRAGESSPMRGMSSESSPSVAFGMAGKHNLREWAAADSATVTAADSHWQGSTQAETAAVACIPDKPLRAAIAAKTESEYQTVIKRRSAGGPPASRTAAAAGEPEASARQPLQPRGQSRCGRRGSASRAASLPVASGSRLVDNLISDRDRPHLKLRRACALGPRGSGARVRSPGSDWRRLQSGSRH